MERITSFLSVVITLLVFTTNVDADGSIWIDVPGSGSQASTQALSKSSLPQVKQRYLHVDKTRLRSVMHAAPVERTAAPVALIDLPLPDGENHTFIIEESPVMAPQLAMKFPDFKTYRVRSSSNAAIRGRLDLLPTGFHAYLTTDKGTVYIDPDPAINDQYRSIYKHDMASTQPQQFSCGVEVSASSQSPASSQPYAQTALQRTAARTGSELLTYRLAVAATYEYHQKMGGVIADTMAEIVTAINRVNEVYERDLAITLQLVANNDQLISTVQGELNNTNANVLIYQIKPFIENVISVNAYDIGHAFSTGGGGLAAIYAVCSGSKAQGLTGLPNPTGDGYYIDFVAHEIGHQFGGEHTFNGTTSNCGSSRNGWTSYEPGSGSTIMAYAGICGAENLQNSTMDTFHASSIAEIVNYTRNGYGNTCASITPTGNAVPSANAGNDYTIPVSTPFELRGSGSDADGDTLTYQWDEMDIGDPTNASTFGTDLGTNPLFRSYTPSSNTWRVMPTMATILSGVPDKAEVLPVLGRTMNFRLSVRDQNGGVAEDSMKVTAEQGAGPFSIMTASTSTVALDVLQPQVIEWDVACTDIAPVSCSYVDIILSTDGGASFSTVLESSAPNIGEAEIRFPNITSSNAMLKVVCSNNIFFDVTDEIITMQRGSGVTLLSTGAGSATACAASPPPPVPGIPPVTTYDVSSAIAMDLNSDVSDSVDDLTDTEDVFSFTGSGEVYTFVLRDYGSSNLDLHFVDSTGKVLSESTGTTDTETISTYLVDGVLYHLVVTAEDTAGVTQSYTLSPSHDVKLLVVNSATDSGGSSSLNLWFMVMLLLLRGVTCYPRNEYTSKI